MSETATAPDGLERTCRLAADAHNTARNTATGDLLGRCADALAKARVALEAVDARMRRFGGCGECSTTAIGLREVGHATNCPIGAALEAMK